MPEAGPGSAETVWVSAGGTAGREANCVGTRAGIDGGMSEVADDCREYRAAGEILCVENLGFEESDGA